MSRFEAHGGDGQMPYPAAAKLLVGLVMGTHTYRRPLQQVHMAETLARLG